MSANDPSGHRGVSPHYHDANRDWFLNLRSGSPNGYGRDAPVDQPGGVNVITELLLAYWGGDVLCYFLVGRATVGRAEAVRRFGREYVALLAYADPRL